MTTDEMRRLFENLTQESSRYGYDQHSYIHSQCKNDQEEVYATFYRWVDEQIPKKRGTNDLQVGDTTALDDFLGGFKCG